MATKGYNITVHAVGDRTNRAVLDMAQAVRDAGYNDVLISTTHSEFSNPVDRKRWKDLNVTAQTAGNFAVRISDYPDLLGQERVDTLQFPLHTFTSLGVNVALGADWPATPGGFEHGVNPFNNMYCAMYRKTPKGLETVLGSYKGAAPLPPVDEVLTIEEAVAAYTIGGAKMLGIEDQVGTIEVGKKADIIMLDQNLFEIDAEDIPKTKVLATMFDGKIVHDVTFGIGDAETVDLEHLGEGAVGPCCRSADNPKPGKTEDTKK